MVYIALNKKDKSMNEENIARPVTIEDVKSLNNKFNQAVLIIF